MESALINILTSLLSYYMPIDDDRIRISIAVSSPIICLYIITKISENIKFFKMFSVFFQKTNCLTINDEKLIKEINIYVEKKYNNKLKNILLGKDSIYIPNENSAISDKFNYLNEMHTIDISYVENKSSDSKTETLNEKSLVLTTKSNMDILKNYLNMIKAGSSDLDLGRLEIYNLIKKYKKDETELKWENSKKICTRTLKNTIVDKNTGGNFFEDIENFVDSQQLYYEKGISYKRGYFIYGQPGTGKTTLIKTIANVYKLPIFIMDLKIIDNNASLLKLCHDVSNYIETGQKHILLFEDYDRCTVGSYDNNITTNCFLNILDGVDEFHGRITILTANNTDVIFNNKALIRPGRIDKLICIEQCTPLQIEKIIEYQCDTTLEENTINEQVYITTAQLYQLIHEIKEPSEIIAIINKTINFKEKRIESVINADFEKVEDSSTKKPLTRNHRKANKIEKNIERYKKNIEIFTTMLEYEKNELKIAVLNEKINKNTIFLKNSELQLKIQKIRSN